MSVSAIRAYTNPAVNGTSDASTASSKNFEAREKAFVQASPDLLNKQAGAQNNLITKKEREFFIHMFPENAEQLEKHVVFNRNGRLQTAGINKGIFVDGRV